MSKRALFELLDGESPEDEIRTVFQPIVDLHTEGVVAFEALSRGPEGTELESPVELFAAARSAGRVAELDRVCRDAALARAVEVGVLPPLSIFVNVEPDLVGAQPTDEDRTWSRAPDDLRCIIELTERALTDRPAELLAATTGIRELAWGLALDDVGADSRSLALMCLLRPDVVKLDLGMVQRRPGLEQAEVLAAVNAYSEETGAVVLAEGIETEEHLRTALGMGATLGQGWFFGRPSPAPDPPPGSSGEVRFLGFELGARGPTPFDLIRAERPVRRVTMPFALSLCAQLEGQAEQLGEAATLLASRPEEAIDATTSRRLRRIASGAALTGVLGPSPDTLPEVRVAALGQDDPLGRELDVVVLAPHFAAAVVSRRVGSVNGASLEETVFELGVTYDRMLVTECARALAGRLLPM